jgi:hypothetical protein
MVSPDVTAQCDPFVRGDLIKRKAISPKARALCLIIGGDKDNYKLYNLATKQVSDVAKVVVRGLYVRLII